MSYYKKTNQVRRRRDEWRTAPISRTCEVGYPDKCGKPTEFAYKSSNYGWMALCAEHVHPMEGFVTPINELLAAGETWETFERKSAL